MASSWLGKFISDSRAGSLFQEMRNALALSFLSEERSKELTMNQTRPFRVRKNWNGLKTWGQRMTPRTEVEASPKAEALFQRAVGREVEGTGAGPGYVRQVAERHGGRAWVQSREGGGAEFMLTFGATNRLKGSDAHDESVS
jgi:hypothetical protein